MSFPRGASQVNAADANIFAQQRKLGFFWCEDLEAEPAEIDEGLCVWSKLPKNARQAVGIDLKIARALSTLVGRSMLTLHNLTTWFRLDSVAASSKMEVVLMAPAFSHVRILLDVLVIDPALQPRLREEYRERENRRATLRFGGSTEVFTSSRSSYHPKMNHSYSHTHDVYLVGGSQGSITH